MTPEAQRAQQMLIELGWQPHQAAALVGGFQQESGPNLNTAAVGDNGTAFGIAQWRGDRLSNLQNWAAANGLDWRSLDAQVRFADYELRQGSEQAAGNALRNAATVEEAAEAAISYERPQGWTRGNPRAGHGWDNRLANANALAGGEPIRVANKAGEPRNTARTGGPAETTTTSAFPRIQQFLDNQRAREEGRMPILEGLRSRLQANGRETPFLDMIISSREKGRLVVPQTGAQSQPKAPAPTITAPTVEQAPPSTQAPAKPQPPAQPQIQSPAPYDATRNADPLRNDPGAAPTPASPRTALPQLETYAAINAYRQRRSPQAASVPMVATSPVSPPSPPAQQPPALAQAGRITPAPPAPLPPDVLQFANSPYAPAALARFGTGTGYRTGGGF